MDSMSANDVSRTCRGSRPSCGGGLWSCQPGPCRSCCCRSPSSGAPAIGDRTVGVLAPSSDPDASLPWPTPASHSIGSPAVLLHFTSPGWSIAVQGLDATAAPKGIGVHSPPRVRELRRCETSPTDAAATSSRVRWGCSVPSSGGGGGGGTGGSSVATVVPSRSPAAFAALIDLSSRPSGSRSEDQAGRSSCASARTTVDSPP